MQLVERRSRQTLPRGVSNAIFFAAILLVAETSTASASSPLSVSENANTITIRNGDRSIVTYNKVSPPAPSGVDPIYERSGCLHPVTTPDGRAVTAMFPFDHLHQHGVFSAWVKTTYNNRPIDFWNLAGGTGRVLHERVASTYASDDAAGFEVDLLHRIETEPKVDVLRERWKVTAYPTDGTFHCFDLETTQRAITSEPLKVHKYHYGGFALRGPTRWLTSDDRSKPNVGQSKREPSGFLNDRGSDRIAGNQQRAKWVALWGTLDGEPVSVAVLCHHDSFRAPQTARLHPTKPYFCYAPCNDGDFLIDQEHPFRARYRFLITDAMPDPEWLDQQWESWTVASDR